MRTECGSSALVMDRSAEVLTWVVSVSELLPETASAVAEDTEAVLDRLAVQEEAIFTTIVIAGAVVTPSEARVQVTVAVPVQVQPVPVADTSVVPEGSGSDTETELATEGPWLMTDRV